MNQKLQTLVDAIHASDLLTEAEKNRIAALASEVDRELATIAFKFERTEKIKHTMGILLESNIEELEQKRKVLERQKLELEIEASLERVRTKAMGMKKPDDLLGICETLYAELQTLGFGELRNTMINLHNDDKGSFLNYDFSVVAGRTITNIPYDSLPVIANAVNQIRRGHEAFAEFAITGNELNDWKEFRRKNGEQDDPRLDSLSSLYYYFYSIGTGAIGISTFGAIGEEKRELLKRFRNVFDLSYQRYTDISIAEAQAREAQIEAAMEKVRGRAMAMHSSKDLAATTAVVYTELRRLGIGSVRCGVVLLSKSSRQAQLYATSSSLESDSLELIGSFELSGHPSFEDQYRCWLNQENYFTTVSGEELRSRYELLRSSLSVPYLAREDGENQEHGYFFSFSEGQFYVWTREQYSVEAIAILSRFKVIVELTFRRYLDLQKAEAQAREAQIEAALERVRSRSMGMQKSEELKEVIQVIYEQMAQLNINIDAAGFNMDIRESDDWNLWMADRYAPYPNKFHVPYFDHPLTNAIIAAKKSGAEKMVLSLTFEEKNTMLDNAFKYVQVPQEAKDMLYSLPGYVISEVFFGDVALYIQNYAGIPYTDADNAILMRFGKVFEQTYIRFNDLKQVEAQSRESQIEAGLERVRSRTLAMQKSDELAETAAVLFRQLIALGIAPNRLYIAIIKDESGDVEFWITDEDGSKVSSGFAANLHGNGSFQKMFEGWREGKRSLTIDMQGKELQEYFQHLSLLKVPFKGGRSQLRRVQNIAFFSKGFIGMASPEEQPQETTQLLERFASVFNLTFTRFNDLQLAEAQAHQAYLDLIQLQAEKKRAEEALSELRATQEQLVQQEKLASLGQLTAGIAHEIKNPLNFVNNFSSVSVELVDEAIEEMKLAPPELQKGEIAQILADVRGNLTKILEHGTRADGIVKSMLYHSRGGSGKMEPSDLNALVREYVNLAFHGMRAGKNPITVSIELDLDESIGKASLVAEDFSRVIVNICQNAFDAMREKANAGDRKGQSEPYVPKLTIRSRRNSHKILLEIEDNGPGIPDAIKDKILQPFFTTKKGTQGTGLGLSITHDIIKAHRGEITIATNNSGGATFSIGLPAETTK